MHMAAQTHNGKIWFTSDLHFGHNKEFLYQPRGFWYIWQHDFEIINNWNEIVSPDDEVYILGDLMLMDNGHGKECLEQLNGHKHIILGNHDTENRIAIYKSMGFEEVVYATTFNYGKYHFFLCHYPTLVGNFDDKNKIFNLHGHTHSPDKFQFIEHCCYNVALDAHNNRPIEINEIINDLRSRRQEYMNEQQKAKL